jgi:hypothetical protein
MRTRTVLILLASAFAPLFASRDASAAKIYVTYPYQKVAGQDTGGCSLQEAIYSSVLHDTLDGVHGIAIVSTDPDGFVTTDCVKGDGDDTIVLPTKGTLTMTADVSWDAYNPFGPTATPIIYSTITIEGNGATIVAQYSTTVHHFRLFAVAGASVKTPNGTAAGTGNLTLKNVHIKGFDVKGGDGHGGGGGGLGSGGAIYVAKVNTAAMPTLTVENSTFEGNGANGGLGSGGLGGGGGGLGGNGGSSGSGISGGGGARGDGDGGGGGTVYPGVGRFGGYLNGGDGAPGGDVIDGDPGKGPGGGGGTGTSRLCDVPLVCSKYGNGGAGAYGGGGGGGMNNGGAGGFGGGGGSSFSFGVGGEGGFGGGAGSGGNAGTAGGPFGGHASISGGGGGGALGGAIFNDQGVVTVRNSTFLKNFVSRGTGGLACAPDDPTACDRPGGNGGDGGGAIFSRDGDLTVENSTFSANETTGSGGAIVEYADFSDSGIFVRLTLNNTIIANNGANECFFTGNVHTQGATNLITQNGSGGETFGACPSPDVTADPQLGPLQDNGGFTRTMAIPFGSVAMSAADPSTSLSTDQRGETRPQANGFDIGAYEVCRKFLGQLIVPFACSETTFNGSATSPLTIASSSSSGGTVSPAPGTYDEPKDTVVALTASPAPGYYLKNWTGNVAAPNNATTTIIIGDVAQSVTANFQQHDFTLAASPTTFTVPLGSATLTSSLTATALGDFGDKVTLTASGQPAGIGVSLSANPVSPVVGTPAASTLTIKVGPSAAVQSFSETITGNSTGLSGALSHPAQVNVTFVMTPAALVNIINQDLALGCIGSPGIAQSLTAKVNLFQTLSAAGQRQSAANALAAFQYEVRALTGHQIAATCTDPVGGNQFSAGATLIADAQALLATLGAQVKTNPILGFVLTSASGGVKDATVNLMSSSKTVIATAITDAAGFYYFSPTSGMTPGADYTVKLALKGAGNTNLSQTFSWNATATVLKAFVLN